MKDQKTYKIKDFLRYKVVDGVQEILLSWVGYKEHTWQPTSSIFLKQDDEDYMNIMREKYTEIKEKYLKKGIDVNELQIINPHLPNAKYFQEKLDIQYHYYTNEAEVIEQQDEVSQEDYDSLDIEKVKRPRRIKKTTKGQRRSLLAKKTAQGELKRTNQCQPQKKDTKQAKHTEVVKDLNKTAPKGCLQKKPKETPVKDQSFLRINSRGQINLDDESYLIMNKKEESNELDPASFNQEFMEIQEKKSQLESLKQLIDTASIKGSFQRKGVDVFYEMEFSSPQMSHPILLHEDYVKLVCSPKLASFLKSKNGH